MTEIKRTCIVTREHLDKRELLRIVASKDEKVIVDLTGKANGRGAYIKKDLSVLAKLRKSNLLERHLKTTIDNNIYEEIEKVITKGE